ncbi:hypothetical protein [Halocatena halophila]|uniref:hypothetical protein n=1 Tax=Halocatena halophila TaxID=2814576 RepID=UPI002ED66A9E
MHRRKVLRLAGGGLVSMSVLAGCMGPGEDDGGDEEGDGGDEGGDDGDGGGGGYGDGDEEDQEEQLADERANALSRPQR